MKKLILILIALLPIQILLAQQIDFKFLEYDKIIADLELKGTNSNYHPDLNYEAILFLDADSYDLLNNLKPRTLRLTKNTKCSVPLRLFDFNNKDIKDFFRDQEELKVIMRSLIGGIKYSLDYIYMKKPNKIFFTIYGNDAYGYGWSNSYGFLLENGKLKLQYESKLIE